LHRSIAAPKRDTVAFLIDRQKVLGDGLRDRLDPKLARRV